MIKEVSVLVALVAVLTNPLVYGGEIVKWKDEKGKVHFGDRVPEKYREKSESVKANPDNVIKNDHYVASSTPFRYYRQADTTQAHPTQAPKKTLNEICAEAAKLYRELTSVDIYTRRRSIVSTVIVKDDNKIMTRREQNREAEKYRHRMNRSGCSIKQTHNMKL